MRQKDTNPQLDAFVIIDWATGVEPDIVKKLKIIDTAETSNELPSMHKDAFVSPGEPSVSASPFAAATLDDLHMPNTFESIPTLVCTLVMHLRFS